MTWAKIAAGLAVLASLGGIVYTQEPAKDKSATPTGMKAPAEPKPATFKVEKKPFKIELTAKGMLEPEETAEISYHIQPSMQPSPSQGPLTIQRIADQGATVKKGDLLVVFDTTKINEVIEEMEKTKKVLATTIRLAEEELPLFEKAIPIEIELAETAKKHADEELKYFFDVGKAQMVKEIDSNVKMSKYSLEFEQEELRQLEKMYKSHDLTEETEKIILRRQQFYVEMYTFYYESAKLSRDYLMNFALPRREKALKEDQVRQELQLEKARKTLAPLLLQKEVSLAKMRFDREKQLALLDRIIKDREAMTIHSPMDGVVYHGKFQKGQWSASQALNNRLVPKGMVNPEEVFLTIVKPRPVVVHLPIEEKDVHLLKTGSQGTAKMLYEPDRKLAAKVTKLSAVPTSPGKFDALAALELNATDANLMPGMACTVKFVPYSKKEAIAVPNKTIHEEDDKSVVFVLSKGGKSEMRDVTPGRTVGDSTEILAGLREGEEVLLERPSNKTGKKTAPPEKKGTLP